MKHSQMTAELISAFLLEGQNAHSRIFCLMCAEKVTVVEMASGGNERLDLCPNSLPDTRCIIWNNLLNLDPFSFSSSSYLFQIPLFPVSPSLDLIYDSNYDYSI